MEQRKFFFETKELVSRKHVQKLREKMQTTSPPAVPYLGTFLVLPFDCNCEREREILPNIVCLFSSSALMLEEIAEIEEKNPQDMINDKMVNFQKRHLIGEVLCKLQRFQSAIHRFCH